MKKIIFGLMMIMGVVMFTSCDPNAGTNDYDDETIVTPTDPIVDDPIDDDDEEEVDNPSEENVSTETLSFVKNNNGYTLFKNATLSSGNIMYYKNVSHETKQKYNIGVVIVDGVANYNVKFVESNDGVTMYIKDVKNVTYTTTTVGTTTTTVFAVTTK